MGGELNKKSEGGNSIVTYSVGACICIYIRPKSATKSMNLICGCNPIPHGNVAWVRSLWRAAQHSTVYIILHCWLLKIM